MTSWIRLTLAFSVGSLLACAPTPEEVASTSVSDSSSSTSAGPGPSTTPGTTTPGDDTVGTQGLTGTDTTMGAVDTTVGVSATDSTTGVDPSTSGNSSTTTGGESSSTGEAPECMVPADCLDNNETCNAMGECESVCAGPGWGPDDYTYCVTPLGGFDSAVICGEAMTCIVSGIPIEAAVCGRSCTEVCDCPAPPMTGTATVTCGALLGDGTNECYLSCQNGETCPDDMVCRGNFFCTHHVQPIEAYGNCDNFAAGCVAGAECSPNGTDSICTPLCPMGIGQCPPALPGADFGVSCATVISPPAGNDCYMSCVMSDNCPPGMVCSDDTGDLLCMWP
jgi:hypothetical protein